MKSTFKKLSLKRESIRTLTEGENAGVVGGRYPITNTSLCPSYDVTLCPTNCYLSCGNGCKK
jgi:hypothetical protein